MRYPAGWGGGRSSIDATCLILYEGLVLILIKYGAGSSEADTSVVHRFLPKDTSKYTALDPE